MKFSKRLNQIYKIELIAFKINVRSFGATSWSIVANLNLLTASTDNVLSSASAFQLRSLISMQLYAWRNIYIKVTLLPSNQHCDTLRRLSLELSYDRHKKLKIVSIQISWISLWRLYQDSSCYRYDIIQYIAIVLITLRDCESTLFLDIILVLLWATKSAL